MNPTIITFVEVVGVFIQGTILITAFLFILRYNQMPELKNLPQNKFLIPLLAGLAMLSFIMLNLVGADILDPNRTLGLDTLAVVLGINLPFIVLTVFEWGISLRKA